jgi:hypothetical protein
VRPDLTTRSGFRWALALGAIEAELSARFEREVAPLRGSLLRHAVRVHCSTEEITDQYLVEAYAHLAPTSRFSAEDRALEVVCPR